MEVLAIDDDKHILDIIKQHLSEEGFVCHTTNSCEKGLELLKIFPIDLVLLDLDLDTNMNGFILINTLRKAKVKVPIIVISGTAESHEKVKAINMGADDYLVKPFDRQELSARIKRHILRSGHYYNHKLIVGEIEMNTESQVVVVRHQESQVEQVLKLTKKEYELLLLLMSKPGVTISKNTILKNLYRACEEPYSKITDVLVCKIRKELKRYTNQEYIFTTWSRGYSIKDNGPISTTKDVKHSTLSPDRNIIIPLNDTDMVHKIFQSTNNNQTFSTAFLHKTTSKNSNVIPSPKLKDLDEGDQNYDEDYVMTDQKHTINIQKIKSKTYG